MSAAAPHANALPKQGDLIANKYRVEKMLGAGGMGAVYLAHHELLRDRVAIKVLLPEVVADKDALHRFINEARNARKIRNEHVAAIEDVDTLPNGTPFIVMEYLEGHDLGQCQKAWGAVAIAPAVDYVIQALEALCEAHAAGIIHRDLKPANLFLTHRPDGSPCIKVLDFGISKSTDLTAPLQDGGGVTTTKAVLGSPGYTSPEQIKNAKNVDARADIWSMGVILYKLLTNHKPFNGDTMGEVFAAIFEETPKPLRAFRPEIPEALEHIVIGRCLQRDRDRRFANVAEMAVALGPFGLPSSQSSVERIVRRLAATGVRPVTGNFPHGIGGGDPLSHSQSVSQHGSSVSHSYASAVSQSQASNSVSQASSSVSQSHGGSSVSQSHGGSSVSQSHGGASISHSQNSQSVSHASQSMPSQGTAGSWAQSSDGAAPQKSGGRGVLIAAIAVLVLLVIGGGAFAVKTALDKKGDTGAAGGGTPSATTTPSATNTTPTTPTTAASTAAAPSTAPSTTTADTAVSIDNLPSAKPTATAPPKPSGTDGKVGTKPKPSASASAAPSDDVLKSRR